MNNSRYPMNGTFELTGRCNLSCKMCLLRVDHSCIKKTGLRELTAFEWIKLAQDLFDAGTLNLLITGGEVMLRPDFTEIYEAIAKMGFMITLYTNATLVTPEIMSVLRKYPPHKIGVTMYGASNDTYNSLCGCKDGYDRFTDGLQQLMTLPSLLDIRTTIVKDNVQDLDAIKAFVNEKYGDPDRLHISRFVCKAIRGGICHPEDVRLTPEENVYTIDAGLVSIYEQIESNEIVKRFFNPKKIENTNIQCEGTYLFQSCKAGLESFVINWAGRMYACELLDKGYTEPLKEGFQKAWDRLPEVYPKTKVIEKCSTCKYSAICETCPANRLAETGDWFGVPEYACREAQLKYTLLSKIGMVE